MYTTDRRNWVHTFSRLRCPGLGPEVLGKIVDFSNSKQHKWVIDDVCPTLLRKGKWIKLRYPTDRASVVRQINLMVEVLHLKRQNYSTLSCLWLADLLYYNSFQSEWYAKKMFECSIFVCFLGNPYVFVKGIYLHTCKGDDWNICVCLHPLFPTISSEHPYRTQI